MAGWCLVLMAVPYQDALLLWRTVSVRSTAVQHKPLTAPPDVQMTGNKMSAASNSPTSVGGRPSLPDLLQGVPSPARSSDGGPSAVQGRSLPSVTPPVRAHRPRASQPSHDHGGRPSPEAVRRCGAQLRRMADELHDSRQTHPPDGVWRRLALRLEVQHLLYASLAIHVALTAVRVST